MRTRLKKSIQLITVIVIGILIVATVVVFARKSSDLVRAAGPIPPPEGYPKLTLSSKVVTPTVAMPDGEILTYKITILNTGAYSASQVTLKDTIPASTTLYGEPQSSAPPTPVFTDGMIVWEPGFVGFDSSVVITFSVIVTPGIQGTILNTAVINTPQISEPVMVSVETNVTDHPLFEISKTSYPALPGKNKTLTYELTVTNVGQDAVATPINVSDLIPANTGFRAAGQDGTFDGAAVNWNKTIDLPYGETTAFTFSVNITGSDVASGTIIENNDYVVVGAGEIGVGKPYTTTVVDPIFILSKSVFPDPPGSNTEMTYTLTVLNLGSRATDLKITDTIPPDLEYRRGGSYDNGVVTWELPSLDTRESAQVTFTVYIGDIAGFIVTNDDYQVCSAEGVCALGIPTPSLLVGPTFEATATLDPIAKGAGGGTKPVTPTLTIKNLGPGNALDATALLTFGNISLSEIDVLKVIPPVGKLSEGPDCDIYQKCWNYVWTGDMAVGDVITITTTEGQSTIGGEEGNLYTATVVITDALGDYVTEPVTGTAIGRITHLANLIPTKLAPAQVAPGQIMTYTIQVFDSAYTTEMEPPPVLTETVPASLTLVSISDGGKSKEVDGHEVITWELPQMGPGDYVFRSFQVEVDSDLVSGTLIINDDYRTTWYESEMTGTLSNLGEPVTTTVHEVGLIDSYKVVSPVWALPGTGTVLTYTLHVVNSGPEDLSHVELTDIFPWEHTTYQRDAVASNGELSSDIVSLVWEGDVEAYSEELITFTVVVDDFFEGVVTNTATISHPSLREDKVVTAVAYITDKPVLFISKIATPDPVAVGSVLLYKIKVTNLGQQATLLTITDPIPLNTTYVFGSASSGGQQVGDGVQWMLPVLDPGESLTMTFMVEVNGGKEIINENYLVRCNEGVVAVGEPVVTKVKTSIQRVLLPLALRQ